MSNTNSQPRALLWLLAIGAALIFLMGAGMMVMAWTLVARDRRIEPPREKTPQAAAEPAAERGKQKEATVQPHFQRFLALEYNRNMAAIGSAERRLNEKFAGYAARVPQFVRELNSLGSKFQIAKAFVAAGLQSGTDSREVAADLFAEQVVSDSQIRSDIEEVVAQFRREMESNRSQTSEAAGQGATIPRVPDAAALSNVELLVRECVGELHKFLASKAEQVPSASIGAVMGGVVAEEAIRRRVTEAMLARAAGSSSGGAAEPPADTDAVRARIVGTVAGVLAGTANYWIMQTKFEATLTKDCRSMLDAMREKIWSDPRNGLAATFINLVELERERQEIALGKTRGGAP